jgi:hypothetical protein
MKRQYNNFRRWQFVKCIDAHKIWADNQNYSEYLKVNGIYLVQDHTNKYGDLRNGPLCIRVFGDSFWHKSSNFEKSNLIKWILNGLKLKYIKKRKYLRYKNKL